MLFRNAQIVSKIFLYLAMAIFLAYHLLPGFGERSGWLIWVEVWEILGDPSMYLGSDAPTAVILSCFFLESVLIPAAPFLGQVWVRSKLAWVTCTLFAGVGAIAWWLWMLFLVLPVDMGPGFVGGGWCLILAPTLNFIGLLFARLGVPRGREFPGDEGSTPQV